MSGLYWISNFDSLHASPRVAVRDTVPRRAQDISEPLSKDSDDLARRKEGRAAAADWSEPLLDVRLAAHNRLNSDITPCLLSADSVETVFLGNKR